MGPPGSGQPSSPTPSRRTGRVVLRAVAVLAVVAALAGLTAWGITNRSSAQDWRDRSEATDARLQTRLAQLSKTNDDLADTRRRLARVASEKAGITDQRELLERIVALAPDVTDAFRTCNQATTRVANLALAALRSPTPDLAGLQTQIDSANRLCRTALSQADSLERTIERLGL